MVTTWKSVVLLGILKKVESNYNNKQKKQFHFGTSFKRTIQMFYKGMDEVDGIRVVKSFQSRI